MLNKLILILIVTVTPTYGQAMGATTACHPLLWLTNSPIMNKTISVTHDMRVSLQVLSDKFLSESPRPVAILSSSGRTRINDPALMASRRAFQDADHAAILAFTYRLTTKIEYLKKARDILISWASINRPTGNPIDETRLDGMIWAYDLIACDISAQDNSLILSWFARIRAKKAAWIFGPITSTNNYRVHQLKMQILLDKVLSAEKDLELDISMAKKYSAINLNSQTGASIDYQERGALYYHNYVMQPWLEISLLTGCCNQGVIAGFTFMVNKILSHNISNEFSTSTAAIDKIRATGGFAYAKTGGAFDVTQAAPTITAFYTLIQGTPNSQLWSIQQKGRPSAKLLFLNARRNLWHP